ncbi:hypothetical protein SAMN05444851_1708 [Aliiroseovarius sediminilitoris]|uniref:Uncharacterized protein n=1 Tax=Aliiroseovarius sediminilitoris TaxID=1173584 RepID=A0A1I0PKD4_9RHOB|nr:hypothetical protein [Aliiroseovarius sediminilitoris]SEW14906.1 hypothetical protein SAMN05444851_1708 [Aliiroseovarius sediminilitoris]
MRYGAIICAAGVFAASGALADTDWMGTILAATEKYADVNVALAEGFFPAPPGDCTSAAAEGLPPEMGSMGIHYIHPGLLGLAPPGDGRVNGSGMNTDFAKPSILLYEPQTDGSLVLVGVENLIFQAAWAEAGNESPPMFRDQPWDTMADMGDTDGDEAHGFEPHYDLHIWTQRENPQGIYAPFNPNVSCG